MRGCRGGVSPCAGLGGSPGATQSITKKEKNKMRVPEQLRSSLQWERQVRATPREDTRVSEQATQSARVGNDRFAQHQRKTPEFPSRRRSPPALETAGSRNAKGRHQSFNAGDEVRPRWKRQVRAAPRERPSLQGSRNAREGTTSSDLAALGHLPQKGKAA